MNAPPADHGDPRVAFDAAKLGLWTFLATEVLLFGALFTAYIVFRMKYPEMFHVEHAKLDRVLGAVNTVVLITSSLMVVLGVDAIKRGKARLFEACFGATILLAGVFLCVKYVEYAAKFHHGLYPRTNLFFSLYFMMTGLHGVHVLLGMGAAVVRHRPVEARPAHRSLVHAGGNFGAVLALRRPGVDLPVPAALPDRVRGSMAHRTGNSRRTGITVFVALLLLTVVTVLVSYVDLGLWNAVVALLIASVKASLVALFFMHLKSEDRLVWGFALVPIAFLALIIFGTLVDTMLR